MTPLKILSVDSHYYRSYQLNLDVYNNYLKLFPDKIQEAEDEANKTLFQENTICLGRDNPNGNGNVYYRTTIDDTLENIKANNNLYELIPTNASRCLYIDIDYEDDFENISKIEEEIIKEINKFIKFLIKNLKLDITIEKKNTHILSSSYTNKISLHFLFKDINFINYDTMKNFINHMNILSSSDNKKLPKFIEYIDYKVYSKNRLFRLVNQSKKNKIATLKCISHKQTSLKKLFVVYYNSKEISKLNFVNVKAVETKNIIKASKKNYDKKYNYKHICTITENDFDKYNNVYDFLLDTIYNGNLKPVSMKDWLKVGGCLKFKYAFDALEKWIKWSDQCKETYPLNEQKCKEKFNNLIEFPLEVLEHLTEEQTLYKKFKQQKYNKIITEYTLNENIILENINRPFIENINNLFFKNNSKTLIIRSTTGTGKTQTTFEITQELINKNLIKSCLVLSTRKAFANSVIKDLKPLFSNIKNYQELNGNIIGLNEKEQLIQQYESIYKLYRNYDIIICDEIESIINIFDSLTNCTKSSKGIYDNTESNYNNFIRIFKSAKYRILADANIGSRTMDLINYTVSDFKTLFINNTYAPPDAKAYYLGMAGGSNIKKYKKKFIDLIIEHIKLNKKLYLVIGSKEFANYIQKQILELTKLTNIDIAIYTSDTDDITFKNDLSDVNKNWGTKKIVITTAKITNGVDFNIQKYFDSAFVYSNNSSCCARDYYQSMRRVRNLTTKSIYYMLASNFNFGVLGITKQEHIQRMTSIKDPLFHKLVSKNRIEKNNTLLNLEYEIQKLFSESGYKYIDIRFIIDKKSKNCDYKKTLPIDEKEFKNICLCLFDEKNLKIDETQEKIYQQMKSFIRKIYILKGEIPSYNLLESIYIDFDLNVLFNILYHENLNEITILQENIYENENNFKVKIIKDIYKILNINTFFCKEILNFVSKKDITENDKNIFTINQEIINKLNLYFVNNKLEIVNYFNINDNRPIQIFKKIVNKYTNNLIIVNTNESNKIIKKNGKLFLGGCESSNQKLIEFIDNFDNNNLIKYNENIQKFFNL